MRLAFLSQNAREADAIGGQLAGQVRAARVAGHEVRVYLSEAARLRPDMAPFTIVAQPKQLWHTPKERAYLESADRIIVEFGGSFPLLDLLPALHRQGRRVLFCYFGVTPTEFWPAAEQPRLREAAARRDWVWFAERAFAITAFAADELHTATGYPRDRIRELPCFLEATAEPATIDLRHRHGFGAEPLLLFVGRCAANKDLPTALRALGLLHADVPTARLVCVGPQDDLYAEEARRCQALARELGIDARAHFLGAAPAAELAAWYRTASCLVMPSRHECFGLPPLEAAAAGLPVVAAQAGALPETLGPAGLFFRPGDAADCARQLKRVLTPSPLGGEGWGEGAAPRETKRVQAEPRTRRIALISPRFGADFAGGAEQSLKRMALSLQVRGFEVEVFATCNQHDSRWANHYPAGTTTVSGLTTHRFPIDAFDPAALATACEEIQRRRGEVEPAVAAAYLANSLGSEALIEALARRQHDFAAILAGPYLFKLVWQAARRFADKLLLVPCFHDEPYAHLDELKRTYGEVAGFLFHTEAEQEFAERRLGLGHPRSTVVGTLLEGGPPGQARRLASEPYFVYCGRFCAEKGLDRLLDHAARFAAEEPTFRLKLLGQGAMPLPKAPWLTNLGFVDEATKRDVLADATALINLSPNESLSIVLLEAWAQGTPVIGATASAVVKRQIETAQGGFVVGNYEEFAAAARRLLADAELRTKLGEQGRRFTAERYQNPQAYAARLSQVVASLARPLPELLREVGPGQAATFAYEGWSPRFVSLLEEAAMPLAKRQKLTAEPIALPLTAAVGVEQTLVPLRLRVSRPVCGEGLGRRAVWTQLFDSKGEPAARPSGTPLPKLFAPERETLATLVVRLPRRSGQFRLAVALGSTRRAPAALRRQKGMPMLMAKTTATSGVAAPLVQAAKAALAEAYAHRALPLDYADVTQGRFAKLKAWAKQKLLHNFRKAYMEPLARQQSQFNERAAAALCHLADAIALADTAPPRAEAAELKRLRREVRKLRANVGELAAKVAQGVPAPAGLAAQRLPVAWKEKPA